MTDGAQPDNWKQLYEDTREMLTAYIDNFQLLQDDYNKAVDAMGQAIGKKAKATVLIAKLKTQLTEIEAQLAEADARADIWEKKYATSNPSLYAVIRRAHDLVRAEKQRAEQASAQAATLRGVLAKVEAWMAQDDYGPLWSLYKSKELGEGLDWKTTLERLRDLKADHLALTGGAPWDSVTLYREVLKALAPEPKEGK